MITYRPYTEEDFEHVLEVELRPADKVELLGKGYHNVVEALYDSLVHSTETFVIESGWGIIGVFGLNIISDVEAIPWMLCSDRLEDDARSFARQSREIVDDWALRFPYLYNEVWEGHRVALRWLEWLGFEDARQDVTYDRMIIYHRLERS